MSLSIRTNLPALHTARTLGTRYADLSDSVRRLSSGLRVETAADDAAGLAVRELMRSDITTLHQGIRNANDAVSLIQTADGALAVIDEKLIRMKELAQQAATGTYNSTQRLIIDSEFQAMAAEIDRIALSTDFNGIKLLDGSLSGPHDGSGLTSTGAVKIHFGPGNDSAEDYYYIRIDDCSTTGLGLRERVPFPDAPPGVQWINEAKIDYPGRHIILDITDAFAGSNNAAFMKGLDFYQLPVGLENITIISNAVTAHPFHKPHVCLFSRNGMQLTGPSMQSAYPFRVTVNPNGGTQNISPTSWWNNNTSDDLIAKGKEADVFADNAQYVFNQGYANDFTIPYGRKTIGGGTAVLSTSTGQNEIGSQWCGSQGVAQEEIFNLSMIPDDLVFFIGGHDNPSGGCNRYRLRIEADITEEFLRKLNVWAGGQDPGMAGDMISIETQEKAQRALEVVDDAVVRKDTVRAYLGAVQNRLENTITNLQIQAENLSASESRISDVDVSTEMTRFVRNQILSQSAAAMLAQANSLPEMLVTLIRG